MPAHFHRMTHNGTRQQDKYGSGQYGASRDGGSRMHRGIDLVTWVGETIYSPIDGEIVRVAYPYKNDTSLLGLVLEGSSEWSGYEIKIFYIQGFICGTVHAGEPIGWAQDLNTRYPGMTNHIHVEVRYLGAVLNPMELFGVCF